MGVISALLRRLEAPQYSADDSLPNDDTGPLPESEATWGTLDFFAVFPWFAFCISNWTVGSSLLALGLTVTQALICVVIAQAFIATLQVTGGMPGADWRIAEPQAAKSSWGTSGYRATVVLFGGLTTIYFGIQMWFGAKSVEVVITGLIPSFPKIPNTFSEGSNIAPSELICVFIFWIICLVMVWFPPSTFKTAAKVASVAVLITFMTIVSVCCARAGGAGPLLRSPYDLVGVREIPRGSQVVWQMMYAISIVMASNGAMAFPTYARLSKQRFSIVPACVINQLVFATVTILFGILATSAAVEFWPQKGLLWGPFDLLMNFMEEGGSGARAGAFFGGLALVGAQLGINIMGNTWMCGVRWTGILPRFMTVRRGGYVTCIIGLAINSWTIVRSADSFTRFLNATATIVAGIDGIYICDYYLVRRQKLKVSDLYSKDPSSIYHYWKGWRAVAALVLGIWPAFPGLVAYVSNDSISIANGWKHLYQLAWPACFFLSAFVYYVFCLASKPAGLGERDMKNEKEDFTSTTPTVVETSESREKV